MVLDGGGDGRGRRVDDLRGDVVGGLQRLTQVGVAHQPDGGVRHQGHPPDHLFLQLLRVRRADPEHLGHPGQRRRFGAGQRDHRGAQFRLGEVTAEVDQKLLHRHLAARADGSAEAECLGADLLVVDPHRTVDRVLGGQQNRGIRGDAAPEVDVVGRDPVQQRLAVVEQTGHAGTHVGFDVDAVELVLQFLFVGVECVQRGLGVAARGIRQQGAFQGRHVFLDRWHQFGTVGGQSEIVRVSPPRLNAQTAEYPDQQQRH